MQQKTFNFFYAFLLAILGFGATLMAEDITLTTYYPAPYGAYEELTTTGKTYLATTSGNVGIGTTAPTEKLHVSGGNIHLDDWYSIIWGGGTTSISGENPNNKLHFITNNSEKMLINSDGNVGIGSSNPQATLDVNGTIAVSGTPGITGTFLTGDAKTVEVRNGIITSITP